MTTSMWVCVAVVVVCVASDVLTRRMPNLVTLGGIVLALGIHAAVGFVDGGCRGALRGVGFALVGALGCGLIPFFAWKKGELGGGDVKLFAAIGALMGPSVGFDVEARAFAFSFLVLFPYRLVRHGALRVAAKNIAIGAANVLRSRERRVAYLTGPKLRPVILGPAIGVATALTLLEHRVLP